MAIYDDIVEAQEVLYLFHPMRDPFYVRQKAGNSVVPSSAVQDASSVIATSSAPIATSAAVRKEWEYPTLPQAGAVTGARLFYQEVRAFNSFSTQPVQQGRPSRFSSHRKCAGLPHPIRGGGSGLQS